MDDCVCYRKIIEMEDTVTLQTDIDNLGYWARKLGIRFRPQERGYSDIRYAGLVHLGMGSKLGFG